jgi:hypothetical protein
MPGGEPIKAPPEALCYLFIVLISKRTGIFQQIVRFCRLGFGDAVVDGGSGLPGN